MDLLEADAFSAKRSPPGAGLRPGGVVLFLQGVKGCLDAGGPSVFAFSWLLALAYLGRWLEPE